MIGNTRAATLYLLLFSLTATVPYTSTALAEGTTAKERFQASSEKSTSREAADSISELLPSLEVIIEPCYVFVRPKTTSNYFGPLLKGEKIKRLEAEGDWIRVWIPRLRISGWVKNAQVKETGGPGSWRAEVPENVLSKVRVVTSRANIRAGATSRAPIIFVANKGKEFWLLREEKGWYQVWLPGRKRIGWVFGWVVRKLSPE
jgi:uncharacterized protein YgiM (DUF1202 family)